MQERRRVVETWHAEGDTIVMLADFCCELLASTSRTADIRQAVN
jgi:hypothetical protein